MTLEQNNVLKIGIDEAGKGPVIGSMFVSGVATPAEYTFSKSIKDSKLLSILQISKIYLENISLDHITIEVTPKQIDSTNLNLILLNCSYKIVSHFLKIYDATSLQVYIDCPWVNESKFLNELLILLNRIELKNNFFVKHKADTLYPVVSLASIFAKYAREKHVAELKVELNDNFGSGYPSDQLTKRYLVKNPACVYRRFKWQIK